MSVLIENDFDQLDDISVFSPTRVKEILTKVSQKQSRFGNDSDVEYCSSSEEESKDSQSISTFNLAATRTNQNFGEIS